MKAVGFSRFGGPEVLEIVDLPELAVLSWYAPVPPSLDSCSWPADEVR